jgi:hypothetical protein
VARERAAYDPTGWAGRLRAERCWETAVPAPQQPYTPPARPRRGEPVTAAGPAAALRLPATRAAPELPRWWTQAVAAATASVAAEEAAGGAGPGGAA